MVRAGFIREVLLCPRRDGEPHQGADVPVRRPALDRRNEGQSTAPLLLRAGLHADGSAAPPGPEGDRMGPGAGGYHPPQAAQDRRRRPRQRAPRPAPVQLRLSLERPLRTSLPRPALLKPSPRPVNSTSTSMHAAGPAEPCAKDTPQSCKQSSHARNCTLRPNPPIKLTAKDSSRTQTCGGINAVRNAG